MPSKGFIRQYPGDQNFLNGAQATGTKSFTRHGGDATFLAASAATAAQAYHQNYPGDQAFRATS